MKPNEIVTEYVKALEYIQSCARSVLYEKKEKCKKQGRNFELDSSSGWFYLDEAIKKLDGLSENYFKGY
jgi:hypothetical protein